MCDHGLRAGVRGSASGSELRAGGHAALVHHQLEVYRLSGLDLHTLRLITRAE